MNVAIIIGAPGLGGAERVTFTLADWLDAKPACHATIIALSASKGEKYDTSGFDYVELDRGNPIIQLRKVIKEKQPDVVLTMTVPLCVYTVPAVAGLNIKHIISERTAPSRTATKGLTRILSRTLMRLADAYVFQTKGAQSYYGGNIAKHSAVIPNPLFNTKLMPAKQYDGCDTKTIVSVGRLNEVKNHPMLIKAFKKVAQSYPDYKLIIYGEGEERANNERLIQKLGLNGKVLLPGATNQIVEAIYNASMFAFTSNYEGMPNALMEAMALGIPCISTDCPSGGPKDLINNNQNGILIPVGSVTSLEEALLHLIKHPEEAKRMGRDAMSIRESHSMDNICQRWLDYFKQVLS